MENRLKLLRKTLGLSQKDFAEKIMLKGNAISMLEQGRSSLTEKNIHLICLTFGVNELWLRTGDGEMFSQDKAVLSRELLDTYRKLCPENKELVLNMMKRLLEVQRTLLRESQAKDTQPPNSEN